MEHVRKEKQMRRMRVVKILKIATLATAGIALFGVVVERLWNWLVPAVFGWKAITFPQALGLLLLSKILFGGFHRHNRGRGWRRGMGERWAAMSPEERERFRAGLRGRGGRCWPGRVDETPTEQTAR